MKKILILCFAILLLLHSHSVFSEAGPPIPKTQISIEKALELSKDQLKKECTKDSGIKAKDFIVIFVHYAPHEYILKNYTLYKKDIEKISKESSYQWLISFCHPITNNISYTFMVTQEGKVLLLEMTM